MLNRVGYSPEISHGVLVEMTEHRKELEKKTKPILDTLRSYQDLPPVIHFSYLTHYQFVLCINGSNSPKEKIEVLNFEYVIITG